MKIIINLLFLLMSVYSYSQKVSPNQNLEEILQTVYDRDQAIRQDFLKVDQSNPEDIFRMYNKMDSIDKLNQKLVFNILDSIGWPQNLSHVANNAIFLTIDHAKLDSQEKYFPLVEEQMKQGNISKSSYATLLDRILMLSGKKQIYGTQTRSKNQKEKDDAIYIWPIQDAQKVDSLRNEMELMPLEMYIQIISSTFKKPCYWDKSLTVNDF